HPRPGDPRTGWAPPEGTEDPSADEGTHNPDDDVAEQTKAGPNDERREEAGDGSDGHPQEESLERHRCPQWPRRMSIRRLSLQGRLFDGRRNPIRDSAQSQASSPRTASTYRAPLAAARSVAPTGRQWGRQEHRGAA